jgi:hypothetical protein
MSQLLGSLTVPQSSKADVDRRLPAEDEVFLDHVGHFVRDAEAASRALERVGFAPTPISIQVHAGVSVGSNLTGTGNITAMLSRGYIEVLFKTADTLLGREFDAWLARHAGLHLAAFAVTDADRAHQRLGSDGFQMRPLVRMQRPVETEDGDDTAAFSIARVEPEVMPEGRIQMLTHHTERAVWQERWLSHPNTATSLIDAVIAVADIEEASRRYARFTGRAVTPVAGGRLLRLDRGGVLLVSQAGLPEVLPEVATASVPFMAGYAIKVESLEAVETIVESADLDWRAFEEGIVACFPTALGEGAWIFVEDAAALPWRK